MKAWILVVKFIFIGSLFIVNNQNLHLADAGERGIFIDSFYDWISRISDKATEITGYVVNSEWLPDQNFSNYSNG